MSTTDDDQLFGPSTLKVPFVAIRHVQTSGSLPAVSDNGRKTIRVTRKPGKK